MQNIDSYVPRKAILYARVSTDGAGPGPLHTRLGSPLPARAGHRGARLQAEGISKTRKAEVRKTNSSTGSSPSWPSMNRHGAAPPQPLGCGTWKEEGIGAEGTLARTARAWTPPPLLAPTLDALSKATRMPRSKPPTRWVVSTRSSGRWKWSS